MRGEQPGESETMNETPATVTTTTRILLVRHGQTHWNATGRWQGHAPVPLDEVGRAQAVRLAERIVTRRPAVTHVVSSDLDRAVTTARCVAERLGVTVAEDPRWREVHLGHWQGLTMAECEAWDASRLSWLRESPFDRARPGGESLAQVAGRAMEALEAVLERFRGATVLVVSHGGTIRGVLRSLGFVDAAAHVVGNASITQLTAMGASERIQWSLDVLGESDHLAAAEAMGS